MHFLAEDQIRHIQDRLSEASLTNASLSIDILDHICCMIEDRLDLGWDYIKAEEEVFTQMGVLQIRAIELETNILTQNKLNMKKRTIIIGLIALLFMVAGFLMKQFHLMGAGIIWGIGILLSVFGFILFLTIDSFSYSKTSLERVNEIIGFLGAGSFLLGLGFNVLKFPLSFVLMWSGALALIIYYILNNLVIAQIKQR